MLHMVMSMLYKLLNAQLLPKSARIDKTINGAINSNPHNKYAIKVLSVFSIVIMAFTQKVICALR